MHDFALPSNFRRNYNCRHRQSRVHGYPIWPGLLAAWVVGSRNEDEIAVARVRAVVLVVVRRSGRSSGHRRRPCGPAVGRWLPARPTRRSWRRTAQTGCVRVARPDRLLGVRKPPDRNSGAGYPLAASLPGGSRPQNPYRTGHPHYRPVKRGRARGHPLGVIGCICPGQPGRQPYLPCPCPPHPPGGGPRGLRALLACRTPAHRGACRGT
jgi:hypothetical protein